MLHKLTTYFTRFELALWLTSMTLVAGAFLAFDRVNYLSLTASLLGVTALILCAKGNPAGQVLVIVFSLLYGYISYTFSYFGEMLTYLGMTMPMAAAALISWLRHPFNGSRSEVEVGHISPPEVGLMLVLTAAVTVVFYFVLRHFYTANLLPSTLSVTTSFIAVYLTFRRIPFFAVAYAANDLVLIVLWSLASARDIHYVSVLVCFIAFFVNDIYGFLCWQRMKKRQTQAMRGEE